MADVTVKYKDATIVEMSSEGTKTLNVGGQYCEDNIIVTYTPSTTGDSPKCKYYEITLTKSSGWVLLTTLDDEVLAHIDDPNLTVSLKLQEEYEYNYYAGNTYICGNTVIGYYNGTYPIYGLANRTHSETGMTANHIFYPANKKDKDYSLGGTGIFRLEDNKYYVRPGDGYVYPGTYKLIFAW